jgi:hypothetical protein
VPVSERPFGEREIAAPDTSTTHVTSSGHAALHAFALISVLKDMLNRFMVAVESPLMRELPPLAARTYAFRRNSSFRDTARCSE